MKKILLAIISILFFITNYTPLQAQEEGGVLNGAFVRKRVIDRKPIPYQYVRESDAMWSKKIWRKIDLHQKMNHKFYYPERKMEHEDRYSLIDLMLHAIENEGLTAYYAAPTETNEFKQETTLEEIKVLMGGGDQEIVVEDEDGNPVTKKIQIDVNSFEVKEYLVKEEWFFDKQRSLLEVRIIGICPVRHFYKNGNVSGDEPVTKRMLFWIYFPEARKVFANHMVLNPYNDAAHQSFEDVFMKRMFASYIVQESNTYNNRGIESYAPGIEALYEADRIKNKIFDFEQGLWEY